MYFWRWRGGEIVWKHSIKNMEVNKEKQIKKVEIVFFGG